MMASWSGNTLACSTALMRGGEPSKFLSAAVVAPQDTGQPDGTRGADDRIAELQLEISRLRRLVTDLLLGKIKLEEAAQSQTIRRVKGRDEHCDNDQV